MKSPREEVNAIQLKARVIFEKCFRTHPLTKDLPGHPYDYFPHPTYFYRRECTYCGEPATTVDVLTDWLLVAAKRPDLPRGKMLVAACAQCAHVLATHSYEAPPGVSTRRRYIGLKLRERWSHHRSSKLHTTRTVLQRRFMYALK